jgi:hypothetical protein
MDSLLSGKLAYVILVGILDAAALSWLLLLWYRRSLRTLMRQRADTDSAPAAGALSGIGKASGDAGLASAGEVATVARPSFALFEPAGVLAGEQAIGLEVAHRRALIRAYGVGAILYALIITAGQLLAGGDRRPWVAWFAMWWVNTWPLMPALIALLVLDLRSAGRFVALYLGAGAVTMALLTVVSQYLRGTLDTAPLTNAFWMMASLGWSAGPPLLLILITGWRRIRAVTPLALASTLMFGFGLVLFREGMLWVFDIHAVQRAILALSALSSTYAVYYGLFLFASLPLGWLAWRALGVLAARFEGKSFSDVQLIVDCWWFIVTAETIAVLSSTLGVTAVVVGVGAFVAYRGAVALGLRGRRDDPTTSHPRLLLLRVFGYQARTEALFDRVAARWRLSGPVQLIAGIDLATRTVDPADILRFLGGRLGEQYVASADEIGPRMARLDQTRDPDGRFRVNDLYCRDDTWRPAVQALLDTSDCVLMDVRSFSEQNQGCVFELEQLVWRLPSEAIVLIVDRSTDLPRLGTILDEAWRLARRAGRAHGDGRLSLVRVERNAARELAVLWERLSGRGAPGRVLPLESLTTLAS